MSFSKDISHTKPYNALSSERHSPNEVVHPIGVDEEDKAQLKAFAIQVLSALLRCECHVEVCEATLANMPNADFPLSRYIVFAQHDNISSEAQRIEKFIHKKVRVIDQHNICWGDENTKTVTESRPNIGYDSGHVDTKVRFRKSRTVLPQWLDDYIFDELSAVYSPEHTRFEYNLDLNEDEVKVYLGTYFPRSYAEAFCIVDNLFLNEKLENVFAVGRDIRILDFCAGTGGELVGLLTAIDKYFPDRKNIEIVATDGNILSLGTLSAVVRRQSSTSHHTYSLNTVHTQISSEKELYGLNIPRLQYDFILCDKAVCELISHGVIEKAYSIIAHYLAGMLTDRGLLLMLDVTTKDERLQRFYPQLMNSQLNELVRMSDDIETLLPLACGTYRNCTEYCFIQQTFEVSHKRKKNDESRVCYRVLCRRALKNKILDSNASEVAHVVNPKQYSQNVEGAMCACADKTGPVSIDSFNIDI